MQWQPATAAAITQHIRNLPDDWPQRVFGVGRPDAALALPPAAIGEQYPDRTPEIAPYDDVASPETCPACTEAGGNCRWHEGFAQGHHDRLQAQIDAMKDRPDMPLREYALWEAEVSEALDNGQTPPALPAAPAVPNDTDLHDRIAALFRHPPGAERLGDATPGEIADAVLAVLPAPADRAAVLQEAIERLETRTRQAPAPGWRAHSFRDVRDVLVDDLRRMADEAHPSVRPAPGGYEATTGHAITYGAGFGMGCQGDDETQQADEAEEGR